MTNPQKTKARNRPLSATKREGIIATAGRMFIENGFRAVSMDAIAAAVPVSKPTLYNHFSSKEALYTAVMEARCVALAELFDTALKDKADIRTTLTRIGEFFMSRILNPESLAMYRVMIGEAGTFPELGRIFYEAGPARVRAAMMAYLKQQHEAGVIRVPDPELSAYSFINMIKGDAQMKALLGLPKVPGPKERERIVAYAVDIFIKGHGSKSKA